MDEYDQQAREFLENHNLDLDVEYNGYGPFCEGDKQDRKIYQVRIRRKNNEQNIVFYYGQNAIDTLLGTLQPTPYDILSAIPKDITCPHDFREFCRVYGYHGNSKIAKRMFGISTKFAEQLNDFFDEDEKEDLIETGKDLARALKKDLIRRGFKVI